MKSIRDRIRTIIEILDTLKKEKVHRLVLLLFTVVSVLGALVYFVERENPASLYKNVTDGIWWAIVTITTVGYGDKYPLTGTGRVIGILLMGSGVVLTVILSGTIASILVDRKMKEGKGLQKIEFTDHFIICGWNATADRILSDFQSICNKLKEKIQIVLINELETDTLNEFQFTYSSKLLQIEFIHGDYTHEQVLEKANIRKSKSIIILADESGEHTRQNSDERTVLAAYTISNLNAGAQISVELINQQNEQYLKRMNISNIIIDGQFNSFLLVSASLFPGIPQAVKEIMNFDLYNDITTRMIPASMVGKSFFDLMNFFRHREKAILIGIISEAKKLSIDDFLSHDPSSVDEFIKRKFEQSEKDFFKETGGNVSVAINPGWDYVIKENDKAVVIGEVSVKK